MPAYTKPEGGLVICFYRNGEFPEERHVLDGMRAAATAITMIAARLRLQADDVLTVRRAGDDLPRGPGEVTRNLD